ncbi:MAG TPA: type II toxin-antitoxin system VapC family toxin [Terracidiphilus sp.]|jgi:predicted nucleic-acid-binding protein
MKIAIDTNVLVRSLVRDHAAQAERAAVLLREASLVAVSLPCLCEFAWVLDSVYELSRDQIADAIETLCGASNVAIDQEAVDAGLDMLRAGGDFADGILAYAGAWLGGETFVSFDKRAVSLLTKQGRQARLLA